MNKITFRISKTNDGNTLVESPLKPGNEAPQDMLKISPDGSASVAKRALCFPTSQSAIIAQFEVMGIIGILPLNLSRYLLVITGRSLVASIQQHKIWRITSGAVIGLGGSMWPIDLKLLDAAALDKYAADSALLEPIKLIINSGNLYYSNTYDLTHSTQHNHLLSKGNFKNTIIDDRYHFNSNLQTAFKNPSQKEIAPWITKIICGFAGAIEIDCSVAAKAGGKPKPKTFTVVLISRLSHRRLGTRFVRRGLDQNANAANNVEMEQLVFSHDFLKDKAISSFVQLRGSVPLIWGQNIDLSYRPKMHLANIDKECNWNVTKKHYTDLKQQYVGENYGPDSGVVVCINLLDDTGFEKPLTDAYEKSITKFHDAKIIYESFPITKWCKNLNYKNMQILMDRVQLPLLNSGFFVGDGDIISMSASSAQPFRISKLQTGVMRVSCLDSLDRTNLTCSLFAKNALSLQICDISSGLENVMVLPMTGVSPIENHDAVASTRQALEVSFPALVNLWADSGDAISIIYAGTRALKSDVTRTGKRQLVLGSLNDFVNSLTRYYLNNFTDGKKQDSYDLWTGKVTTDILRATPQTVGKPPGMKELLASKSLGDCAISALKMAAPSRINTMVEFCSAFLVAFWILFLSFVLSIKGSCLVSRPVLTTEYNKITEIDE